jgi:hypothetical protein
MLKEHERKLFTKIFKNHIDYSFKIRCMRYLEFALEASPNGIYINEEQPRNWLLEHGYVKPYGYDGNARELCKITESGDEEFSKFIYNLKD